jgi:murein DD-endopeptidase MepM/ murein hydrolase activator NlpD
MKYQPTIFPDLLNKTWAQVNLGQLAQKEFSSIQETNPLLNPEFCENWVKKVALEHQADFTWGGHFEDRKHLWRGYYEGSEKVTHLGVDYNVPAGTKVATPRSAQVVHVWADSSIHNGWGGRVILKLDEPWENAPYLIFGHLAHDSLPKLNQKFNAGEIIAKTGVAFENGGWFAHLHVQCANEEFYQAHLNDLTLLDGYYLVKGQPFELAPNPTLLVGKNLE